MFNQSMLRPVSGFCAAVLLMTSSAPAWAGSVVETHELQLLESVVAASGENSAKSREEALRSAITTYMKDAEGVSSEERTRNFSAAAEVLGLNAGSVLEVGSVFKDAVASRKGQAGAQALASDATLERNLTQAFSRVQLPKGAQFDSFGGHCKSLQTALTAGLAVGIISGLIASSSHPRTTCIDWEDDYYGRWCGYTGNGFYSCDWGYYDGRCRQYAPIDPSLDAELTSRRRTATVVSAVGFVAALGSYSAIRKNGCTFSGY
jgi:hypothetical protein